MAKVVVLGGGVAGLSAAHELAERGFDVVLIEKTGIPGGKARSSPVMPIGLSPWRAEARFPSSAGPTAPVPWIPGEHGFRFFPGFYRHVVDTMARIPTPGGITAADHLVPISRCALTQYDKPTFNFPMRFPRTPVDVGSAFAALLGGFSSMTNLTVEDLAQFGGRIWQILTSCQDRRLAEYEKVGWWAFIGADARSVAYQKFLATGITRSLVAAKAHTASTRTIGNIFVQLLLDILDPLVPTSDRVLDGPTNQTWIYPWLQYVRSLGVKYMKETAVTEILCAGGRVTGVRVRSQSRSDVVCGDYYVCALPVERFAPLVTPALLAADPSLESVRRIADANLEWMNGVQFYFRKPVRVVRGHMNHIDTEWALTSISQVDVWRAGTMDRYGPETVQGIVSVDVSDWRAPAADGRTAMEQTREEVCQEVWRQLKRSVNTPGEDEILREEDLIGWFIDSAIDHDPLNPERLSNAEPLLVNQIDTWRLRPEAVTAIPNFFLSSDYVRTFTDLATMEAANEAARRAVNGILDANESSCARCQVWPLHEPTIFAPFREYDAIRFGLGLPWDPGLLPVASTALKAADPVLEPIARAIDVIAPVAVRSQLAMDALESSVPSPEQMSQPLLEHLQQARDALETAVPVVELERAASHVAQRMSMPQSGGSRQGPTDGSDDAGPSAFEDRLEWYRSMTLKAVDAGIPDADVQSYLYEPIREFVHRPSKALRPALCLATCRAFGGTLDDALASAAGLELLHNAFLVHDDIEDGSESRRGRPTMHRTVGTPLALNIGDAINALAMRMFRRNVTTLGPDVALRVLDEVDHLLVETLEGQALELGWIRDNNCRVGTDDYLRLVLKKTAWYSFIHPMRIGTIVAGTPDLDLDRFNRFGFLLGAAFQIQDDILNLVGDEARYGKEVGGDLWEGKRTLPLAHSLAHSAVRDRSRIEAFLAQPREARLPRQLLDVRALLEARGSIDWSRQAVKALAHAAQALVPETFAGAQDGLDLSFMRELIRFIVERDV